MDLCTKIYILVHYQLALCFSYTSLFSYLHIFLLLPAAASPNSLVVDTNVMTSLRIKNRILCSSSFLLSPLSIIVNPSLLTDSHEAVYLFQAKYQKVNCQGQGLCCHYLSIFSFRHLFTCTPGVNSTTASDSLRNAFQ